MRVLVTGHGGYIGAVLVPMLEAAGHEVLGVDVGWFEECSFGTAPAGVPGARIDVRDLRAADVRAVDAVIHLAALSNDPLSNLDPALTREINHLASVRLAALARQAGARRFLFSSSCSLYGGGGDAVLTETADFMPITPYAESKILVEREIARMASDRFSPVFLRNATAYGVSPRLRVDLMVNSLVGHAITTGDVLILSDGTPWRPLVHVEDIARAFVAALGAPRERIHNQAFNVGRDGENYRVREVAAMVAELVPGSRVRYAAGGGPDRRNYRVDFGKITRLLPEFAPRWTVRRGIEQLAAAYRAHRLTAEQFQSGRYARLEHLRGLRARGLLDDALRRRVPARAPAIPARGAAMRP